MRTLVKGGIIVTVDAKRRVIEDGCIRIEDGVMASVSGLSRLAAVSPRMPEVPPQRPRCAIVVVPRNRTSL